MFWVWFVAGFLTRAAIAYVSDLTWRWRVARVWRKEMERRRICPFCGLTIIVDLEARTTSHEAPLCAGYMEVLARYPPEESTIEIRYGRG